MKDLFITFLFWQLDKNDVVVCGRRVEEAILWFNWQSQEDLCLINILI